jgi:hypothetical protein
MFGRILEAQQAKIPHEKSKGLRAGSIPSKRGLIIRGMLTPPDRPLGLDGERAIANCGWSRYAALTV